MYFLLKNYIPTLSLFFHTYTSLASFFFLPLFRPLLVDLPPRFRSTLQKRRSACESFVVPFIQPDKSSTTVARKENFRSQAIRSIALKRYFDPTRTDSTLQPTFFPISLIPWMIESDDGKHNRTNHAS